MDHCSLTSKESVGVTSASSSPRAIARFVDLAAGAFVDLHGLRCLCSHFNELLRFIRSPIRGIMMLPPPAYRSVTIACSPAAAPFPAAAPLPLPPCTAGRVDTGRTSWYRESDENEMCASCAGVTRLKLGSFSLVASAFHAEYSFFPSAFPPSFRSIFDTSGTLEMEPVMGEMSPPSTCFVEVALSFFSS